MDLGFLQALPSDVCGTATNDLTHFAVALVKVKPLHPSSSFSPMSSKQATLFAKIMKKYKYTVES